MMTPLVKSDLQSLLPNDQLLAEKLVMLNEGFRSFAYDDATGLRVRAPRGDLSIGYGTNLAIGLSSGEAITLMRNRLCGVEIDLLNELPVLYKSLSPYRKIAFLDIGYNLGVQKLLTFTTFLGYAKLSKWNEATDDLAKTAWDGETHERATRDIYLLKNDEWLSI